MDVVTSVRGCLSNWAKGGESECRNILISPHCNPTDPGCADVLTTAYHALVSSTLATWPSKHPLTPTILATFIQSVLSGLPSSSTPVSPKSFHAVVFGELFVDTIWSIDSELDEVLADAKTALSLSEQSTGGGVSASSHNDENSSTVQRVIKAKQDAEKDKDILADVVRRLLLAGVLDPSFCRERLDLGIVAAVGLILDQATAEKKVVRTRTGLFYKQSKFNLLREQSEGYSKLTIELASSLGPPHSAETGSSIESPSALETRARGAWKRVVSIIGYFDLDPNRALDIILDIFSVHIATHYSFFLSLLSYSPWSGAYKRSLHDEADSPMFPEPGRYKGKTLDEILLMAEGDGTSTGGKSKVMAQVLGFKFGYYQLSDVTEPPAKRLFLTAALLICHSFITLEDLYPHLSPIDSDMDNEQKKYLDNIQSRIAGAKNSQLAMAAPLESAASTSSSKSRTAVDEKKPSERKEIPNQKLGLLSALLSVGALRPALAILSKFPWMIDAYPELADLLLRTLQVTLSSLYDSTFPPKDNCSGFTQPRARFGVGSISVPPSRKPQLTIWAPTPPSTSTTDFMFFYPKWTERIPVCSCIDDVADITEPIMRFIGLHVSRDSTFITKFLRLGRSQLGSTGAIDTETKKIVGESDLENPICRFWFNILRRYMLPALPLIRGNAVCAVEVWNVMRQYETTLRWRLYGEWKTAMYSSHPELRIRRVQADRESKGILRRLSHNTVDTLACAVAKLAHSNPCIFFVNAVNQVMAYDNLAAVVILALRYVTLFGFDVLVYIILDALANPNKERVKDDGVNTSDWLQSLASFTGMLFRKYTTDLTPLLKYIVHQLHDGQTTEIIALRELIWKSAGIEPLPSLSEAQIAAMAGGPVLRIEAVGSLSRGARMDPSEITLRSPQRLGRTLLESSLALPLLVQVAQQRQSCVFRTKDAHLKSIAGLFDITHGVLLQYLELLSTPTVLTALDYAEKVLPSLGELGETYGICAPICMQIFRPKLHAELIAAALALQEQERLANEEAEKRLKANLIAKREAPVASTTSTVIVTAAPSPTADATLDHKPSVNEAGGSEDVAMVTPDVVSSTVSLLPLDNPWLPQLFVLFDDVKMIAPGNAYEVIGPGFYLTFWQMSTYDLAPPASRYDEEGATLRTMSRQEDSKYLAAERSSDRTRRQTAAAHRMRRDRYNLFATQLAQELKEQTVFRAFTMKRLAREKLHWFTHNLNIKATVLVSSIIEHCIQPRCLLSPMDADYCAQIIKVIHTLGTPGFATAMCYNRLLGEHIKVVVFSCSEYEARNYGRFLLGILSDLWKWHQDEQLFMQDNRTKAGGKTILLPGFHRKWPIKAPINQDNLLSWSDFKQFCRKCHTNLGKSLLDCIETGDFMRVYNAIIVLKEVLPVFPMAAVNGYSGAALDTVMQRFLETEERGDLKILGRAYAASLKKREALWAMPKPIPPKSTASKATSPAVSSPNERSRTLPTGPSSQTVESRRNGVAPPASAPSAPRAQLANSNNAAQSLDRPSTSTPSTKLAIENIPRPELIKRVPRDAKSNQVLTTDGNTKSPGAVNGDTMDIDPSAKLTGARTSAGPGGAAESQQEPDVRGLTQDPSNTILREDIELSTSRTASPAGIAPPQRKDLPQADRILSRPATPSLTPVGLGREPPRSPRGHQLNEGNSETDTLPSMPPPTAPSQTASAQELRDTAKQIISSHSTTERLDEKRSRPDRRIQPSPSSPRSGRRTPSPPTRPGTRNVSADSRGSGSGRARSDREGERSDDRHLDREHIMAGGHRDSRSDRDRTPRDRPSNTRDYVREGDREKDSDRDRDRDRDRGRDRHGDRERERERERDRDREKDRDRDRDRHRRDDKDRDRESRKDRELPPRPTTTTTSAGREPSPGDRGSSGRTEPPRLRNPSNGDDNLGKRRRPPDDEPDRGSKRSSRKDSHRDDRGRRPSEKDSRDRLRESDRRRKDRDVSEVDGRPTVPSDKIGEKVSRVQEGPLPTKPLTVIPPSAPRAMASGSSPRSAKPPDLSSGRDNRDWKNDRDHPGSSPVGAVSPTDMRAVNGGSSLRSRIGDKELPPRNPHGPPSSLNAYRPENPSSLGRNRNDSVSKEDDRDGSKKRTLSDREQDSVGLAAGHSPDQSSQPPKRPRIQRNRYGESSGLAKKLLPIDPQAGDKGGRSGRKD